MKSYAIHISIRILDSISCLDHFSQVSFHLLRAIDHKYLHVKLEDGRIISTPLNWYQQLLSASEAQKKNYILIGRNTMIEWPELDLHPDIEEMLKVDSVEEEAAA